MGAVSVGEALTAKVQKAEPAVRSTGFFKPTAKFSCRSE